MIYISSQTLQKALNDTIPIIIYYIYKSKIFLNIFDNFQFILHCILRHILTTSTLLPPLSHTHALTPLHQLRGPFVWSKCLISPGLMDHDGSVFWQRAVCSKHCVLVGLGQRPWYQGWATHLLHRLPSSKLRSLVSMPSSKIFSLHQAHSALESHKSISATSKTNADCSAKSASLAPSFSS